MEDHGLHNVRERSRLDLAHVEADGGRILRREGLGPPHGLPVCARGRGSVPGRVPCLQPVDSTRNAVSFEISVSFQGSVTTLNPSPAQLGPRECDCSRAVEASRCLGSRC